MSDPVIYLLGDPVAHSRSPAMQNAALAHLGIKAQYLAWHTPRAELAAHVERLREPHVLGANITLPHKEAVVALLDGVEPVARAIGAVNTIFKQPGGLLWGTNTDAPAVVASLRHDAGFDPAGHTAVILGASGAARAAGYALLDAGLSQLVVVNRTVERAETLCADLLAALGEMIEPVLLALAPHDPQTAGLIADADLVVNATSLGWRDEETPLPEPIFKPGAVVLDMVYRETRLVRAAAAAGARPVHGLGMLVHQGALALERWVGRPAPVDVMWAALR